MHIGARIAIGGHTVQGADSLPFNQNHPLITGANGRQIGLRDYRLGGGGTIQKRIHQRPEIFIITAQTKHARPAIAENRFQNNIAMLCAEIGQGLSVARHQRRRQQTLKAHGEYFFRRITHGDRVIHHQNLRVNTL